MSFPGGTKFFLLRKVCHDFVEKFEVVYGEKERNMLASEILRLNSELLSFGFLSELKKIKRLMPVLVKVLDGRIDARKIDQVAKKVKPFDQPKDRYKATQQSEAVTALKTAIIDIMLGVADLRANFRLGNFLLYFKNVNRRDHGG